MVFNFLKSVVERGKKKEGLRWPAAVAGAPHSLPPAGPCAVHIWGWRGQKALSYRLSGGGDRLSEVWAALWRMVWGVGEACV